MADYLFTQFKKIMYNNDVIHSFILYDDIHGNKWM